MLIGLAQSWDELGKLILSFILKNFWIWSSPDLIIFAYRIVEHLSDPSENSIWAESLKSSTMIFFGPTLEHWNDEHSRVSARWRRVLLLGKSVRPLGLGRDFFRRTLENDDVMWENLEVKVDEECVELWVVMPLPRSRWEASSDGLPSDVDDSPVLPVDPYTVVPVRIDFSGLLIVRIRFRILSEVEDDRPDCPESEWWRSDRFPSRRAAWSSERHSWFRHLFTDRLMEEGVGDSFSSRSNRRTFSLPT